jgi:hypothetical protein
MTDLLEEMIQTLLVIAVGSALWVAFAAWVFNHSQ